MKVDDPRYDNQGLHVVLALFTVDDGKFKVLLIKRKNEPFKNKWIMVGGCAYNTEMKKQGLKILTLKCLMSLQIQIDVHSSV